MPKIYKIKTANGELHLNSQAVRNILYSKEVEQACTDAAQLIKGKAGEGYDVETFRGHDRVRAIVQTNSQQANNDNLENNTLLKAVGKW